MTGSIRKYVLLTGSDLGDRSKILKEATEHIAAQVGRIVSVSEVLESEPWGFESDTSFLNQAIMVETEKAPLDVLKTILEIEMQMGRTRKNEQWTSRTIDIDILSSEDLIFQSDGLTIPHKHLHEREFALRPLSQIAPNWIHPILLRTSLQLIDELDSLKADHIMS